VTPARTDPAPGPSPRPRRILLLGATGSIGRAALGALAARGHEVVGIVRPGRGALAGPLPAGALLREAEATDPASLARDGIRGEPFGAIVSCLASRTGVPHDAWAVDHGGTRAALAAARAAGIPQMLLLSAICVQKPRLAFQHAKLAAEAALRDSGLAWTIVRPTAFFKSLSGQIGRVRAGRPYLIFGDGRLTACKPISDGDLAAFIADALDDPAARNRILPVGGPGPAITPREQGERLFAMLGRPARFRSVPAGMLGAVAGVLGAIGRVVPGLAEKAELARIGRYYATESMLVLDPATGRYDEAATPEFGQVTLWDHYAKVLAGEAADDRGAHAVF
jgi:divinyl chlorophyllide a 8-vinyl-reductase